MGFLLTAALVLQTLLGKAASGDVQELYEMFSYNYTFYFYGDNDTYDYPAATPTIDYHENEHSLMESAGSSLQSHLPFFIVLLHLLCFLLQKFTRLW